MGKALIAFFSRADENYLNGRIQKLKTGNTEVAAGILQKLTGADLFRIEQEQPYPEDYNECIEQARRDQEKNARPELSEWPESISGYDVIYLGYPNYWSTMPMAVFAFRFRRKDDKAVLHPRRQRNGKKSPRYKEALPDCGSRGRPGDPGRRSEECGRCIPRMDM